MQILKVTRKESLEAAARAATEVLVRGGIILYPTDTIYGLGASAFSDQAVDTLYQIKGREKNKPIHAVFRDVASIKEVALWPDVAERLAKAFLPGPLTLILPKLTDNTGGIARDMDTIGVRIPNHPFCQHLSTLTPIPYTTTSANRSGKPPLPTVPEILKQLGDRADLIDLVIDYGQLPPSLPSTIIDLSSSPPTIIREGAIARALIDPFL